MGPFGPVELQRSTDILAERGDNAIAAVLELTDTSLPADGAPEVRFEGDIDAVRCANNTDGRAGPGEGQRGDHRLSGTYAFESGVDPPHPLEVAGQIASVRSESCGTTPGAWTVGTGLLPPFRVAPKACHHPSPPSSA
jgi:hypothetical protein